MKRTKKDKRTDSPVFFVSNFEIGKYNYSTFDKIHYKYIDGEDNKGSDFSIKNFFQVFLSITSFVVVIHFCISLYFLLSILSENKIDTFGVLQSEDISYSLANTNISLSLTLSLLFLAVTYSTALFFTTWDTWENFKLNSVKKRGLLSIYILAIVAIICTLVRFMYEIYIYTYLILTFVFILIVVPFVFYVYNKDLSKLISALTISFVASVLFFVISIKCFPSTSTTRIESQIEIELIDSSIIRTDSTRALIYFGQKYVIFKNDSTETQLVPTSQIKNVKYSKNTVKLK